ncbi:DNA glycosylase [Poronia punctata]|nr:DNA glycosylase [Poronia punctata]
MPTPRIPEWRKLPVTLSELCIDTTLRCGQAFRWQKINDEWNCVLHGRLLSLKQDDKFLHYKVTWPKGHRKAPKKEDDTEALLRHYFSLETDLAALYSKWAESDPNFREKAPKFTGIRILNQDAWETLIAFICSSNNNISRISSMVEKLCIHYGPFIGRVGDVAFYDFPSPEALTTHKTDSHLRKLGFGYRASYIALTATMVSMLKPEGWLQSLMNPENPGWGVTPTPAPENEITYKKAHEQLLTLSGVGPKVADCVCLMGLGWAEAVPVDTHVWQIAQRDYNFGKSKTKTFTKSMYDAVGDHFRKIWGPQAGWAQSVLFTANLKSFSEQAAGKLEPAPVVAEIKQETDVEASVSKTRKRRRTSVVQETKVEEVSTPDIKTANKRRKRTRG